jgi:predicted transcriptional regulator
MPELTLEALAARLDAVERMLATLLKAQQSPPANAVASVPGVDPAEVWEAAAEADAGRLAPHAEVFMAVRAARK